MVVPATAARRREGGFGAARAARLSVAGPVTLPGCWSCRSLGGCEQCVDVAGVGTHVDYPIRASAAIWRTSNWWR